jgi:hypothetical protein
MMEMPLADVYDRVSILLLKWIHGGAVEDELRHYGDGFYLDEDFFNLLRVNAEIWKLESAIRNGDASLTIEEIGRRAVMIREWNKSRIAIKNKIADQENGYRERKIDHASA